MNGVANIFSEKSTIMNTAYAVFISFLVIAGVLFSSVEISEEIHHHCNDNACHICYTINLAKSYINGLNLGENLFYYVLISFLSLGTVKLVKNIFAKATTLVSLKVKLSN